MNRFDPGIDVRPTTSPMGFSYGTNVFGPAVENRHLDSIRKSLMDPLCHGPDIVYTIAMDVGNLNDRKDLVDRHLLFGVVTYASGRLGNEPIRSQGHIHKASSYANGWSTPEVYQIWSGKGIVYMQERADDDPGRCYAVEGNPGDIIIVPPSWAHATISADPYTPLTFGAWCDRDYGFVYDAVRAHKGLAWYPMIDDEGSLSWHHNKYYKKRELEVGPPTAYRKFQLENNRSIYRQYEEDRDRFDFVPRPDLYEANWTDFIP